jgi:hypothetical protein
MTLTFSSFVIVNSRGMATNSFRDRRFRREAERRSDRRVLSPPEADDQAERNMEGADAQGEAERESAVAGIVHGATSGRR